MGYNSVADIMGPSSFV